MPAEARKLGPPRAEWLASEAHEKFGAAMARCQNVSGCCVRTGTCHFSDESGDCFRRMTPVKIGSVEVRLAAIEARLDALAAAVEASAREGG